MIRNRKTPAISPDSSIAGNAAIVFGGGIGDMVVFLDSLSQIVAFRDSLDCKTTLITKSANLALLHAARPDIKVNEISVDLKRMIAKPSYLSEKLGAIKQNGFDVAISPLRSKYADIICLTTSADRRITVDEEDGSGFFNIWRRLNGVAYTDKVRTGTSAFTQYRDLAVYLGVPFFETRIAPLTQVIQPSLSLPNDYCVIAPTASEPAKCWEQPKVDAVIEFILDNSRLDICLLGGPEGNAVSKHVKERFSNFENRIHDLIDKTDFETWIGSIRDAKFVFGDDSASIHLASHQKVPSLCVSSLFCYGYCQPYHLDKVGPDDEVPVSINADMYCARCHYRDYKRCAGNHVCKKAVRSGGVYQCISNIGTHNVIPELKRLMIRLGLYSEEM